LIVFVLLFFIATCTEMYVGWLAATPGEAARLADTCSSGVIK